jgi:hypothetical protein
LLALFGVVTFVAVGCAALANPSKGWCACVTTSAFAFLLFAAVLAVYGRSANRAFWLGFVLCGGGYVYLQESFDDPPFAYIYDVSPDGPASIDTTTLATTWLLEVLCERKLGFWPSEAKTADEQNIRLRFLRIGQSLWALLFGLAGGLVARHLYLRRERQATSKPPSG